MSWRIDTENRLSKKSASKPAKRSLAVKLGNHSASKRYFTSQRVCNQSHGFAQLDIFTVGSSTSVIMSMISL